MNDVPRIVGGAGAQNDALRKRLSMERELQRAATHARAKAHWAQEWSKQSVPLVSAAAPTNAVFQPVGITDYWSQPSVWGIRRDRVVWIGHAVACMVHLSLMILTLVASAQAEDPWVRLSRAQFLFTRNVTDCGILTNFSESTPPLAVQINTGAWHIGAATAGFFALSASAHGLWVAAGFYDGLGKFLFGNLQRCVSPVRWVEYAASASLMLAILTILSGGRDRNTVAAVFMLCCSTMLCGLFTELGSRPEPDLERWQGDKVDGSNRFANYCVRMIPHVCGFLPSDAALKPSATPKAHSTIECQTRARVCMHRYFSAWAIILALYLTTLEVSLSPTRILPRRLTLDVILPRTWRRFTVTKSTTWCPCGY